MRSNSYFCQIFEYNLLLTQTGSEQSSIKEIMEISRHVNGSVALYTSYIFIHASSRYSSQVRVLSSKNRI